MKENPGDIVTERILNQAHLVSDKITKQLKNTKPFARELISPTTKIWAIDHIHPIDMMTLQKEFGDEAIDRLIYEIEKLKADGRRKQ